MSSSPTKVSSVLSTGGGQALLDTSDSVILLMDHQSGLFQTVKDISLAELRANTTMLAKLGALLKIPVITTASELNGPNGPLMPEIHESAAHAMFVPRKGAVNAWDNQDFAKAVHDTGRKTLVMAGVWTSVCVMFPACQGGRIRGVCSDGCLGRSERVRVANHAGSLCSSRRSSDFSQRGIARDAPHLETPGGG